MRADDSPPQDVPLDGVLLGVATASVQIEGGDRNNSWYDWSRTPGHIADGSTPERSTDHWRRWREDTELMANLGVRTYRMSLEWARIEPVPGWFDAAVLGRYREEITDLVERGITPLVTLHHFSNPRWFQESGEFLRRDSVRTFLRYAARVVDALGDLVTDWVTFNEPNVYTTQAYLFAEGPPGRGSFPAVRTALRHMAIAHHGAYALIHRRASLRGGTARVGIAHHMRRFAPLEPRNPVHRAATRVSQRAFQDWVADAFLTGRFRGLLAPGPRGSRPGRYYDVLGLNYYSRTATSGLSDGTFAGTPVTHLGWEVHPEGLAECARELHARYRAPVWVTENGACDLDDSFRPRFIRDHLAAVARVREEGVPVERYYHWCFVDNWEWNLGEVPRFGLVHLDYETQERTVKASGRFYAEVIARGCIDEDLHARYVAGRAYPSAPAPELAGAAPPARSGRPPAGATS